MKADRVLKDWASGHWPGFVHMRVWMRVSCFGGWGVLLQVRGNRHHGHRLQGPPGPRCPPLRGDTWPGRLDRPLHHKQTVHPPAKKQPDTQMVAASPSSSVRRRKWNQLVRHQRDLAKDEVIPWSLGKQWNVECSPRLCFSLTFTFISYICISLSSGPPTQMTGWKR